MLSRSALLRLLGITATIAVISVHAQEADQVAKVNGAPILAADVDAKLGNNLAQLQQQIFNIRQKQLDSMIDQKLLEDESAKRGVTISELVQTEITSHVTAATTEEAQAFFKENSAKLKGDFKSLEEQIQNFLTAQRLQVRQQEYLKSLRAAAKIDIFLKHPPIFRSEVAVEGSPVRGEVSAPVTIVEFSDFHCPFCRKVQPVMDELRARYGAKIKIVYRDFPLDNLHPKARVAAEASHCAIEQGKFWEFHDRLFKNDPESTQAGLNRIAKEVGMDVAAFEACSTSGKYKSLVQTSAQEGTGLGITGTPTFFINGRILVGAQSLDAFVRIIDEELAAPAPQQSGELR
ncbi:MAG TPA: thioredoxin domain-containing protein [Bryobacteraceae bacterium]|jgi:protein-disulfide isomerase